jgi:microcystin-dependent protein
MRHRPRRGSRDDSQARGAPPADASVTLKDRAVAAARAELRGERTAILGATGRLSLPRLEPPRRVPERWTFVSVAGQITLRIFIGATWVPMMVADTSTGAIIDDPLSPKYWVAASGTHDAITATYDPPVTAPIADGTVLSFRATSANLTAAPTFSPSGLSGAVITKNGGQTLAIGDIPGSLAEVQLRWNLAQARFELLNPPAVPVGGIVPYFGGTVPSGFALPQGQNLSATSFPAANAVLGTTYGNPGGGNFTMPDLRGRYPYNLDAGGSGRITSAGGNWDGTVLGNTGGQQNRALSSTSQLPQFTPSGSVTSTVNSSGGTSAPNPTSGQIGINAGSATDVFPANQYDVITITSSFSGATIGGSSPASFPTLPPSMGINFMMRIL